LNELKEFATEKQLEYINAIEKHGSVSKAAKALGVDRRGVDRCIARVKARAAKRGIAPLHDMNNSVPEGYLVKGVSTLYDADGGIKTQWVKSLIDPDKQAEMLREVMRSMASEIKREKPVKSKPKSISSLLSLYILTDYHLGMKAWGEETGADWDMKIAEDTLVNAFKLLMKAAPPSTIGVLGQLGDFLHYDGLDAVTPAHHHILDADTRFQKIVRVAIRALRRIVKMMLEKHQNVHIIMAEGNHDPASSIWLRELFAALYEDEPRITVDQSADPYYCYEFGKTCLFLHHGHKRKPGNIDDVFVAKFREEFGRTEHAYAHLGHLHHDKSLETNLMTVEQHRTLASPDAFASRGGWMSGRSAKVITYSGEYGEVARSCITPEML